MHAQLSTSEFVCIELSVQSKDNFRLTDEDSTRHTQVYNKQCQLRDKIR
jgi:hypothetical protein